MDINIALPFQNSYYWHQDFLKYAGKRFMADETSLLIEPAAFYNHPCSGNMSPT